MIPDENKLNSPGDEENVIRELRLLICIEENKPIAERDEALISECIREIANLKGVRSSHSQEEVDAIIAGLKKRDKAKKAAPRRVLRWLIPIAAIFILATAVTAVSVNPLRFSEITKWFFSTLQIKTKYNEENVDLIITNDTTEYKSLDELAEAVEYPLLLPYDIEENMENLSIVRNDCGEFQHCTIKFEYLNTVCNYYIEHPVSQTVSTDNNEIIISTYRTHICEIDGEVQISWYDSGTYYCVKSESLEINKNVIEHVRSK